MVETALHSAVIGEALAVSFCLYSLCRGGWSPPSAFASTAPPSKRRRVISSAAVRRQVDRRSNQPPATSSWPHRQARPGTGPFPVVVFPHDCSGLSADVKAEKMFHPGRAVSPVRVVNLAGRVLRIEARVLGGDCAVMPDSFTGRKCRAIPVPPRTVLSSFLGTLHGKLVPRRRSAAWFDARRVGLLGLSSGHAWHVARAS